jgi:hypothetical protein
VAPALADGRARFRSLGTCSFVEPVAALAAAGWLDEAGP